MRYVSDDGKVFNTEMECLEHEKVEKKRIEEERIRKEKIEAERINRLNAIKERYQELQKLLYEYGKDYNMKNELHFMPFYEIINMFG